MGKASVERVFTFRDDPMFKRVMEREDICKGVLERILGKPIREVSYYNTEQEHRLGPDGKAIRMDSYLVESGGSVYDVEMQVARNSFLGLRFRGYQSVLDGTFFKRGEQYHELRESFIIFICVNDPFGCGLPVYHLERTCAEQPDYVLPCGAHWIALNASAYSSLGDNDGLGSLLQYIYTNEPVGNDPLVQRIDEEVIRANEDRKWVMMMLDSISIAEEEAMIRGETKGIEKGIEKGLEQGLEQGRAEGESRYAHLVSLLLEEGRIEDLKSAGSDVSKREELFQELGI